MNCYKITAKIIKRNSVKKGPDYPQKTIWMAPYGHQLLTIRKTQSLYCLNVVLKVFWGSVIFTYMHPYLKEEAPLWNKPCPELKGIWIKVLSLTGMIPCWSYLSESVLLCKILWVLCWTVRTAVTLQKALPRSHHWSRTGGQRETKSWYPPAGHCRPGVSF